MNKNYKLQNTNYKQITNYNVRNYKQKTKGGHSLHKESSRLQTMTAFNEKLLRGVQGGPNRSPLPGAFLEKSPPGRRRQGDCSNRYVLSVSRGQES